MKRHLTRDELIARAKAEATAYAATGRAVKLISLVILEAEFHFNAEQLKTFVERFDDTLEYYDRSNDYNKLLDEWNEYFKETIGEDVLKWSGIDDKPLKEQNRQSVH